MGRTKRTIVSAVLTAVMAVVVSAGPGASYALDLNGEWLPEKPEWAPDISFSTTFLTKYIWRGQNLGDDPVMQPDLSMSKCGLTLDIWGSYDTGTGDELTELDYTIDYTFNVGEMAEKLDMGSMGVLDPLSLSAGYTYYTFPNVDWDSEGFDTHEVYLGCAYDILLQPSFTWYWDVDTGHGCYYTAGIGHTFEFDGGISAGLGMTAAYNDEQWTDRSGWSDMVFSGDVTIPFFTYFTVTPSVAYSVVLDRDTYNDAQSNEFYGGVSIGFAY
ncbi:MAG: hypothetical protein KAS86_04985 [Candidatus Omnitrophica bacterium]|nr:hypothetical protein [Candidatus Omnitrophota bacterium]